jgi:isopentenyldiphosphate isomerase
VAKSRKIKSKKELEKEGRTLGIELDRRHSKEDLIEELELIKAEFTHTHDDGITHSHVDGDKKHTHEESSDVTWNSIEEFTESVTSTGMLFNPDFIPVNIPALYEAYTSNLTEFKQTAVYKFLTQ